MKSNILQRILSIFRSDPSPQFIAQQLRKPTGEFANKIAAKMDVGNAPLFDLTLDTMHLKDHESILEIGFGSGKFFSKIIRQANGLQVSGIDYSSAMVEKAKSLNEAKVTSNHLTLRQAASNNIPFSDNSFDKVFCNMVIYFWDQPAEHLKEISRVLKPEGRFYTGLRTKESMKGLPFTRYGFSLYDRSQWESILEDNGFIILQTKVQSDPEIQLDGQVLQLESICIEAGNSKRQ